MTSSTRCRATRKRSPSTRLRCSACSSTTSTGFTLVETGKIAEPKRCFERHDERKRIRRAFGPVDFDRSRCWRCTGDNTAPAPDACDMRLRWTRRTSQDVSEFRERLFLGHRDRCAWDGRARRARSGPRSIARIATLALSPDWLARPARDESPAWRRSRERSACLQSMLKTVPDARPPMRGVARNTGLDRAWVLSRRAPIDIR